MLWRGISVPSLVWRTGPRELSRPAAAVAPVPHTVGILVPAGSAGSPPLVLFLRKVLFHRSCFMKSAAKSYTTLGSAFQEPCEHTLPSAFVLGEDVRRWQRPSWSIFATPPPSPSVFTQALNFLHKVIRDPSRTHPQRASRIFVFSGLMPKVSVRSLKRPCRFLVE